MTTESMTTESTTTKSIARGKIGGIFVNMKVRHKILGGFMVVVAVLAVVSGVGYFGFATVNREVGAYANVVEDAALTSRIETEFLKLRTHAREFANSGKEEEAAKVKERVRELKPLIEKALVQMEGSDAGVRKNLEDIKHEFTAYIKDFGKAEKLEHNFKTLIDERLEPAGVKIVEDLDTIIKEASGEGNADAMTYASVAREHALLARLYANILIGRQDDSFGEKAEREFEEFAVALDSLGKSANTGREKELHAQVTELFHEYEAAFEKTHEDESEIRLLIDGEMAEAANKIAENTEAIGEWGTEAEEKIREETEVTVDAAEFEMLIVAAVGIAIGFALAFLIGIGISKPVAGMTTAMRRLADGDKSVEIPGVGRGDEIGEMAVTVQVFKDNAIRVEKMEAEQAEQERRAEEEKKAAMNKMADDFEASVGGVVEGVSSASTELQSSAQAMSATAEETSRQSTAVAAASEEASTNVQTVASAAEELSSSISEIGRQVSQSSEIAGNAVTEVEATNTKIQGLAESAQKIGEVVELITDIADQTNLLALNATIEAARAGEAGKGFAVVASEVKNLANQTAKATEEIGGQITGVQNATQEAVEAIGSIGKIINQINEIASAIAAAVEEQGAATQEIARNVEQASAGTQEVSSNITGVTQAAGETGQAAGHILEAATTLSTQAETLSDEVDKFLGQVRVA